MLIFDKILLPFYSQEEFPGGFDDASEDGSAEDAVPSDPPSDSDFEDELSGIAADVVAETKGDDDSSGQDDQELQGDEELQGDTTAYLPEHMSEWTEEQLAAYEALPDDAKEYLRDPSAVIEYAQGQVQQQMRAQYEPLIRQLEPLMNVLADPGASEYLARRETELGISQQDIIRNVLQADAMLTYSTNTQQRYEYARQLLQGYGIDPIDLALGNDGGQNYQQQDMQQQLQQERWRREQIERHYHHQQQQQAYQQTQQNVDAFSAQTGTDGQPIRPMMNNPAVRASMGHLIASGQAHSLDQAYQMVAAPLEAEIAQRSQYLARQQQQNRQNAVMRSARARPVRVNTASHGGAKSGQSIEDIVGGVVSEMM